MNKKKNRFNAILASRGKEREDVLRDGGIWTRPTMYMESKKKYNRNRQKKELRNYSDY